MKHTDKGLISLYIFYAVNFIATGMSTFVPKYYGEIGLTDGRIGVISAVAAFIALGAQPLWGTLADRSKAMRSVLAAALALSGVACFFVRPASGSFPLLLVVVTLYSTFWLPAMPVGNAIAIEYTARTGHNFGPVRMMGTIGYQVGILLTGVILAASLSGLYPLMGAAILLTAGCALLLPGVRGYQHGGKRVPITVFFRDRTLMLLFVVAFLANIAHQFNLTFFSKHLGDLGFGNALTGLITVLGVVLEIPFLLFGDRIMRRFPIWTWLIIGLATESLRFMLLAFVRTPTLIVLAQLLSIAHLACFEFIPFIYLGRVTEKPLLSSVQSVYQMISFGIARIVGSLLGGALADAAGIPAVYGMCGGMLLAAVAVFFIPLWAHARRERA